MKKKLFFCGLLFLFLIGCSKDNPAVDQESPVPSQSHTLLVYMMGNNGLTEFMDMNLMQILEGAAALPGHARVAVFYDRGNYTRLTEIYLDDEGCVKQRLLEEWDSNRTSSVDPAFMADVMDMVQEQLPADTYGLILSSHGGGWVPSRIFDSYVTETTETGRRRVAPLTRFFGQDGNECMEISELVSVLAGRRVDYILFDACFMASVEALYDLCETTGHIIASSAEIMGTGFPYREILPMFFQPDHGLEQICRLYMEFYRSPAAPKQSATISLVDCSRLEALSRTVRNILAVAGDNPVDVTEIQSYDGFTTHLYFDLEQYVEQLTDDATLLDDFRNTLRKSVPFSDHTEQFYSDYGGVTLSLPHSCGLTCHIGQTSHAETQTAFLKTAWAKAVGAE